jgi:prepilin-type N-terminal cleavage/methylation domain-containing protein
MTAALLPSLPRNMKIPPTRLRAFTLTELLVVLAVIALLVLTLLPGISRRSERYSPTQTLSNARQLQVITQQMSLDQYAAGGDGIEWTSVKSDGEIRPAPLATYFETLGNGNYLSDQDLKRLLTGPGIGPGNDAPNAENICFKFFQVEEASPLDQPLLVTANWEQGLLSDNAPYGKKRFIVFSKGGEGAIFRNPADASSKRIFPTGETKGIPFRYNTLK